jgi:hypothetical protein
MSGCPWAARPWGGDGGPESFEYDLLLAPGADPGAVRFRFTGAKGIDLDANGDLVLRTAAGEVRQTAPRLWQESGGARVAVRGSFRLLPDGTVGLEAGAYDRALALVVDPQVSYSTYLGGTGSDTSQDVVVDSAGKIVVTGYTSSTDFPLQSAYQAVWNGGGSPTPNDTFVTKYAADGQTLVFSTYLGGTNFDEVEGVAVDSSDNVVLCGRTASTDFPTASPFQAANAGGVADIFITKLAADGQSLLFSTYFGTASQDESYDVACDSTGVYLSGATNALNFPMTNAAQPTSGGGVADALLMKFNTTASSVTYCTYIGGLGQDVAVGLAVDSQGALYAAGETSSTDFPVPGGYQTTFGGSGANPFPGDAFCLKLAADGGSITWSTFLGGNNDDICEHVAVDSQGSAYLAGHTASPNFPIANPYQGTFAGGSYDAFCTKVSPQGSSLIFSTYFGGTGIEVTSGIGLDSSGDVFFCGYTQSLDYPVSNPFQATYQGGTPVNNDGFITMLNAGGISIRYSSYLGGPGGDDPRAMALDLNGNAVVVGLTDSTAFPVVNAKQPTTGGGAYDSYVMRIVLVPPAPPTGCTATLPGTGAVQVGWTDGSTDEDGFEIERKGLAGPFVKIVTKSVNATQHQDFAVSPSTTYTYRVRAVNGDGASAYTNEATVTTPALVPPPTSPNNLVATPQTPTQVALTWSDRSSNENAFEIQRRAVPGVFAGAGNLPEDSVDWVDNGVPADSHVVYRVRAVGATTPSAWSNEASAQTAGTVTLTLAKGSVSDSTSAGKDKAKAKGTYFYLPASPDDAMDPLHQEVTVMIGGEDNPFVVVIPANDLGWKLKNGKATWKSPKDSLTKTTVVLDLVKLKFSIAFSKVTLPGAASNPVRVSLRVGNDAGSSRLTWKPGKNAGAYSYKP